MSTERRRYRRVKLGLEDGFFGNFQLSDGSVINAPLVNLSAGGVNFVLPAADRERIKPGSRLVLLRIFGVTNFELNRSAEALVRWIGDPGPGGTVPVGCEFQEIDESERGRLERFVDAERVVRGQYD